MKAKTDSKGSVFPMPIANLSDLATNGGVTKSIVKVMVRVGIRVRLGLGLG